MDVDVDNTADHVDESQSDYQVNIKIIYWVFCSEVDSHSVKRSRSESRERNVCLASITVSINSLVDFYGSLLLELNFASHHLAHNWSTPMPLAKRNSKINDSVQIQISLLDSSWMNAHRALYHVYVHWKFHRSTTSSNLNIIIRRISHWKFLISILISEKYQTKNYFSSWWTIHISIDKLNDFSSLLCGLK